jgi:hypothetical protein
MEGPGMTGTDWLPALDALICRRLRVCTLCGQQRDWVWSDIWPGPPAMAFILCTRCRDSDPGREKLHAVLAARYAPAEEVTDGTCRCGGGINPDNSESSAHG